MSNLQKYGTWTPEARKREAEEVAKAGGGDFLKLGEGRNVLRFLPPKVGMDSPFVMVWQHYVKKPGSSGQTTFACPRAQAKRFCPVCDYCERLRKTGVPADRELAYQMSAKLRVLANVIDRNAPDKGPQILGVGKNIHEQLLALADDVDAGGDFTMPEPPGYDVIIVRQGTGRDDTKYQVLPSKRASSLGNLDWIEAQPDLARFTEVRSAEEIEEILGIERSAASAGHGPVVPTSAVREPAMSEPRRTAQDLADEEHAD